MRSVNPVCRQFRVETRGQSCLQRKKSYCSRDVGIELSRALLPPSASPLGSGKVPRLQDRAFSHSYVNPGSEPLPTTNRDPRESELAFPLDAREALASNIDGKEPETGPNSTMIGAHGVQDLADCEELCCVGLCCLVYRETQDRSRVPTSVSPTQMHAMQLRERLCSVPCCTTVIVCQLFPRPGPRLGIYFQRLGRHHPLSSSLAEAVDMFWNSRSPVLLDLPSYIPPQLLDFRQSRMTSIHLVWDAAKAGEAGPWRGR